MTDAVLSVDDASVHGSNVCPLLRVFPRTAVAVAQQEIVIYLNHYGVFMSLFSPL